MDDVRKQSLVGSKSRDVFKRWHKDLGKDLYALDIDLMLITKRGASGGISAIVDFKLAREGDNITFTEAIAYKFFIEAGVRVFIVVAKGVDEDGYKLLPPVYVRELLKVTDWKPPAFEFGERVEFSTVKEFSAWERKVRKESFVEVSRYG